MQGACLKAANGFPLCWDQTTVRTQQVISLQGEESVPRPAEVIPGSPWLRLLLLLPGVWVQSLVRELKSHPPPQKKKHMDSITAAWNKELSADPRAAETPGIESGKPTCLSLSPWSCRGRVEVMMPQQEQTGCPRKAEGRRVVSWGNRMARSSGRALDMRPSIHGTI